MISYQDFQFQHGAMSIIQMGEELIGHPTTAINELVKNSYDADAFESWVYINYHKEATKSFIIIFDNGTGMNDEVLFRDWLYPSMSTKRTGPRKSPILERNYLGSKGIGRLAAMALGSFLTVISKTSQEDTYNWLLINRESFKQEVLLDKIKFPGGKADDYFSILSDNRTCSYKGFESSKTLMDFLNIKPFRKFIEGTLIIIEVIDHSVINIIDKEFETEGMLYSDISFLRALKVLLTPLKLCENIQDELLRDAFIKNKESISKPESAFKIHFGLNLLEEGTNERFIPIDEIPILSVFDYRLYGFVDEKGNVTGKYICNRLSQDTFSELIFLDGKDLLKNSQKLDNVKNEDIEKNTDLGQFLFDIRVYDRDEDSMLKISTVLKTEGKIKTKSTLDSFLGLRVSKNGFGVKPYGEENKDWMQLGQMRVQNPTEILGTNQILGNIFLFSPTNDKLNEKTNREGFFETPAFIELKTLLRGILLDTGKRRYRYRVKHNLGRTATSKFNRPDSVKFLSFLKSQTNDSVLIQKAETYINETNTTLENLENSLTFSERLAALGSGLELVYHELSQPTSLLGSCLDSLDSNVKRNILELQLRQTLLTDIANGHRNLELIDELKKSLQPAIGKSRPANFYPSSTFQKVKLLFRIELKEKGIQVDITERAKSLRINSFEYIFWIAFLNIFNNAAYWLDETAIENRNISFDVINDDTICISNNSPLIPTDYLESIFEYGVTFKKEKTATGLGLAYTRSLLNKIDYGIHAANLKDGPAFYITKRNENESNYSN